MPVYASCDSLKSGTRSVDLVAQWIIIRVTKRKVAAKSLLDQRSTLTLSFYKKRGKEKTPTKSRRNFCRVSNV